jgi:Zn-dependent protease
MGGPLVGILQGIQSGNWYIVFAELIVLVLLLLIAFPIHELAHAVTARALGDDTAEKLGRITLNPLMHLDPFGTILFALTGFGWAKPVPVSVWRLQGNPRTSFAIVALAGPASNIILAIIFAVLFRIVAPGVTQGDQFGQMILFALLTAVNLNIFLALFNLIPIPPLDGSRLLAAILPDQGQAIVDQLERYGFIILLALSATGILGRLIIPPANFLLQLFTGV